MYIWQTDFWPFAYASFSNALTIFISVLSHPVLFVFLLVGLVGLAISLFKRLIN